ncbi:unnamed protein product [Caenorhabditis angaria]|uniref:Uncharacterized protein n=1 Tax=Caenorhabditis angaria TaxID=860376 RepID=A0A9P1MWV7_9PELO|nr:unnamed protein product [Caenorhabditis angaria]
MSDKEDERVEENKRNPRKRQGSQAIEISASSSSSSSNSNSNLPPWVAGGSPAKFISHDEILKMSTELENLELVHEIAIDPNFSIPDKPKNPIEACVRENMHKAYFELLRKDLSKNPPEYEYCFGFLMEIKTVNAILDESTLRNKMEQEALNINQIMNYVIELLSRLCCPERDQLIEELKKKSDIIDLFKGTMELLELMKNDLTNYQISQNRTAIEEYSAKHEYEKFQQFLAENPSGCDLTRKWLSIAYDELFVKKNEKNDKKREKKENEDIEKSDGLLVDTTSRAYVKLVQSENPSPFPETMKIDKIRIQALAEKFSQIVICASAVFVTCNVAGKEVSEKLGFKKELKDHLIAITNNVDEESLSSDLEKMAEQCVKEAKRTSEDLKIEFSDEKSNLIRNQIKVLTNLENPIRSLVINRVSTFVEEMLRSPTTVPHRLLPGLSVVQSELCAFTARFLRLCVHNRKTFYELYQSLILEFQVDKGEIELDRTFCKEASPSQKPGTSSE